MHIIIYIDTINKIFNKVVCGDNPGLVHRKYLPLLLREKYQNSDLKFNYKKYVAL